MGKMMSKKQWFALLCVFVVYLLMGAALFHKIESKEEYLRLEKDRLERKDIQELLRMHMSTDATEEIYEKLTTYCGKPLRIDMENIVDDIKWDFYHSLFFVITVVSTIGYGNLAPTTMATRIFMIFYGLIGIPMNGIVMVTLGSFFGRSFTKLYHRWKTDKMQYNFAHLNFITQIILYLVPGFTFFIFFPSVIMMVFEGWNYDVAVYYSFVTLTTIGFGDYVAGVKDINDFGEFYYTIYQVFLLVWVIGGLGYIVMVLGFITQGMRSKKIQEIEHIISNNIKQTPSKIRQELRSLLSEFLFLRVKRVYKQEFDYTPTVLRRSMSCPDLTIYRNLNSPSMMRKRALSECPPNFILQHVQSDTDLDDIDKDMTFKPAKALMEQKNLLFKLVDALSDCGKEEKTCYDGFSDEEVLASENWSLNSHTAGVAQRRRAISQIETPKLRNGELDNYSTLYPEASQKMYEQFKNRARTFSAPTASIKRPPNFFTRLRNRIIPSAKEDKNDVEANDNSPEVRYIRRTNRGRPSVLSAEEQEAVLEQTSIADFIRALSAITVPESLDAVPRRKIGNTGTSTPVRCRRMAIRPQALTRRRSSLAVASASASRAPRRFSLRPVEENLLVSQSPPPAYTESVESIRPQKFSKTLNVTLVPHTSEKVKDKYEDR